MAKRPDNVKGSLIFQEGKRIEGEYYIIAVYDDPATCTISFSAYELENDCTYTLPYTYSEFDHLFRFDSELMNPSHTDGRFHWVIERLDFIQDHRAQKVLVLGHEVTPEGEDEEEEDAQPKAAGVQPAAAGAGRVDALTRAKLLQELDTHDDEKLHRVLVKSEGARKRFLTELFKKRQLEQLKASQRLQKTDEEREARLAKLDIIKKQQQDKAAAHRAQAEANKSTMAQLEALMKQKEAQAIRRLIQQKDEEDRGAGKEKSAARQKKQRQEQSAKEVQAIENQRAQQLARKREEQVEKRNAVIRNKDRAEAERVRERREADRAVQVRRREEKDQIIEEQWRLKREFRMDRENRTEEFQRLEEIRNGVLDKKDKARAKEEGDHFHELREIVAGEKEETETRRRNERKEYLLQWKVDATKRAVSKRENQSRNEQRAKKLQEREELRLRKFRETQFRDTAKGNTGFGNAKPSEEVDAAPAEDGSPSPTNQSFDQQERAKRAAERAEKKKQEEAKKAKVDKLGAQNPNAVEITRIREWRQKDEEKKKAFEQARLKRELDEEKVVKQTAERLCKNEEMFVALEKSRRERSIERANVRNQAIIDRTRNVPIGTALPLPLVY